jgi:prepilin-type processing-associated H-X9-DG protein
MQTLVPILFCPARRSPMLDLPGQDVQGTGAAIMPFPGACGDYGCCAGDGNGLNTYTANGAMLNGHVISPAGPGPQAGVNGIDQPNNNPAKLPLVPILQFKGYTTLMNITDGTSNTFMLGEKHVRPSFLGSATDGDHCIYNGAGYDSAQRVAGPAYPLAQTPTDGHSNHQDMFGSWHTGVCNFAFCDGHVVSVNVNIDLVNLQRLAIRNDGQPITVQF